MRMARQLAGIAAAFILLTGVAAGQGKPGCDASGRVQTPAKIAGQVTKIDPATGVITFQEANGTAHQIQASKEMLQKTKVGDHIEGTLREAPKC